MFNFLFDVFFLLLLLFIAGRNHRYSAIKNKYFEINSNIKSQVVINQFNNFEND
jgi:hypothetical protein